MPLICKRWIFTSYVLVIKVATMLPAQSSRWQNLLWEGSLPQPGVNVFFDPLWCSQQATCPPSGPGPLSPPHLQALLASGQARAGPRIRLLLPISVPRRLPINLAKLFSKLHCSLRLSHPITSLPLQRCQTCTVVWRSSCLAPYPSSSAFTDTSPKKSPVHPFWCLFLNWQS